MTKCKKNIGLNVYSRKDGRYEVRVLDTRYTSDGKKNTRAFTVTQQKRHWKKPSNFNMKAKTAVTVKEQNKQSLNGWHNGGRII